MIKALLVGLLLLVQSTFSSNGAKPDAAASIRDVPLEHEVGMIDSSKDVFVLNVPSNSYFSLSEPFSPILRIPLYKGRLFFKSIISPVEDNFLSLIWGDYVFLYSSRLSDHVNWPINVSKNVSSRFSQKFNLRLTRDFQGWRRSDIFHFRNQRKMWFSREFRCLAVVRITGNPELGALSPSISFGLMLADASGHIHGFGSGRSSFSGLTERSGHIDQTNRRHGEHEKRVKRHPFLRAEVALILGLITMLGWHVSKWSIVSGIRRNEWQKSVAFYLGPIVTGLSIVCLIGWVFARLDV